MNKIIKYAVMFSLLFSVASCEINDPIDDWASIGQQPAHVYWELPSTLVKAGENVSFIGQYYTNDLAIQETSVWYDVMEKKELSATCPLAPSVNYSLAIDEEEEVRANQLIEKYAHAETLWDADKSAYVLSTDFPVSNTLGLVEWVEPSDFDATKFAELFPSSFASDFKAGLFEKISIDEQIPSYRAVLTTASTMTVEEFNACVDSTFNDNKGDYDKFIKEDCKALLQEKYNAIPFENLIYKSSESKYLISYARSYSLNATFRVLDEDNNLGVSEAYTIDVN